MANKATHQGHCQLCGHFQKLPGNVLSKHGYTKRWGFFSGVCGGAGYRPFEKSTDRIQIAIDNVKRQIADQQEFKAKVEALTDKIYVRVFIPATWENRKSHYKELILDVADLEYTKWGDFVFNYTDEKTKKVKQHKTDGDMLIQLPNGEWGYEKTNSVKVINRRKIDSINHYIKQMEEYVAWQEERVAKWVEEDLTPVTA